MKTQGITLMTSQATEVKVKKKTNASDSTFENFIANNASSVGRQNTGQNANIADTKMGMESRSSKVTPSKKSEDGSSSNISQSKDANGQVNNTQPDKSVKTTKSDEAEGTADVVKSEGSFLKDDGSIDIEKVNEEVMAILQDILGLLPQDLEDIFNGLGMQPAEIFTGLKTGEIESFSIVTVQTFVMEVHGIEDPSAFLTNDLLTTEMNDIFDRLKNLLSELMRMDITNIDDIDEEIFNTFAGNLVKAVADTQVPTETIVSQDATPDAEVETEDGTPDMSVIIENHTSDQAGSGTGQNAGQGTGLGADNVRDAAADLDALSKNAQTTNTQAFAESLTQALEPEANQVQDVQRQMTEMVEQVVRQVRVRMMPESTNMEIQLHPASLGRVNVQINATGQETTARLIVENQAAKEALEAGMIRLQEAFEERGVKVQAVEVTVGSFEMGLEQSNAGEADGDGDSNGRSSQGGSSEGGSAEAETTEGNMTAASRRDINSTVDYTA